MWAFIKYSSIPTMPSRSTAKRGQKKPANSAPPIPPVEAGPNGPIRDCREAFARKTPPTAEDSRAARAFIDGKIEMVRRDPHLSDAEKARAVASLKARR
jgi:hypothetical protein